MAAITVVSMLPIELRTLIQPVFQRPVVVLVEAFIVAEHLQSCTPPRTPMEWTSTTTIGRQRQHGTTSPFLLTSPSQRRSAVRVHSNVAIKPQITEVISDSTENNDDKLEDIYDNNIQQDSTSSSSTKMTSEEVKVRMEKQLERLKLKDRLSPNLSKEVCQFFKMCSSHYTFASLV